MRHLATALVGALALASLAPTWAGEYEGTFKDNGVDVPVTLNIDPAARLGKAAGKIRFEGGWACGFDLQLTGADEATHSYSYALKGGGAGRCGPLTLGHLQSQSSKDDLQIQLFTQGNTLAYRVTLAPPDK
ncbi:MULTISPECIES: hypothetical protein [unclassified Pseudomonas]|uniref:hypothetical protein n=1 Tax=unclassified Pseudomonas TaxID=196821 RepID=UPI00244B671D|nr:MULTISPECIES: hypothetical protein [unclassified Pseudomonas]MDH0300995.1 hypothetical protein [Pseudomonas sp. GD04091]MDH1983473.1 hypothetical protein [Pseudomonas sp. GD03689]